MPLEVTGVLKDWVEATDLEPYRQLGGRKIVELALSTIDGYIPTVEIREDYMSGYVGRPLRPDDPVRPKLPRVPAATG